MSWKLSVWLDLLFQIREYPISMNAFIAVNNDNLIFFVCVDFIWCEKNDDLAKERGSYLLPMAQTQFAGWLKFNEFPMQSTKAAIRPISAYIILQFNCIFMNCKHIKCCRTCGQFFPVFQFNCTQNFWAEFRIFISLENLKVFIFRLKSWISWISHQCMWYVDSFPPLYRKFNIFSIWSTPRSYLFWK